MSRKSLVAVNPAPAGLGNRIRFTLSAQAIAEVTNRKFSYVWPTGPGAFGARMHELWEYDAPELEAASSPAKLTADDDLTELSGQREWVIKSPHVLKYDGTETDWEELFRALPLAQGPARRVAAARSAFGADDYIGVQVRLHPKAHAKTLEASPLEWYLSRMRDFVRENPETRFYVSCDEPVIQAAIVRTFPNAFALEDKGDYNSLEALENTLVDLYLLAGSRHILAPHYSSLAYLAWTLGLKRQILETSMWVRHPQPPADV